MLSVVDRTPTPLYNRSATCVAMCAAGGRSTTRKSRLATQTSRRSSPRSAPCGRFAASLASRKAARTHVAMPSAHVTLSRTSRPRRVGEHRLNNRVRHLFCSSHTYPKTLPHGTMGATGRVHAPDGQAFCAPAIVVAPSLHSLPAGSPRLPFRAAPEQRPPEGRPIGARTAPKPLSGARAERRVSVWRERSPCATRARARNDFKRGMGIGAY